MWPSGKALERHSRLREFNSPRPLQGCMQIVQTELASGSNRMICWLPRDPRVKVGAVISLAKSDTRWRVLKQYGTLEHDALHRDWKVGGLPG